MSLALGLKMINWFETMSVQIAIISFSPVSQNGVTPEPVKGHLLSLDYLSNPPVRERQRLSSIGVSHLRKA